MLLFSSSLFPNRTIRFVKVDVSRKDLEASKTLIELLIHPKNTVLDFNIGAALWFAARGQGTTNTEGDSYISPAKIILSGLGADEHLAGYRRHIMQFRRHSWSGMNSEMETDIHRLWERNLGRDNRLFSYHGRRCEFPFLDENVIRTVRSLPLYCIARPSEQDALGDKKILRVGAREILGLHASSGYTKRAIQVCWCSSP